jgi:hypothetical protein
MLLIVALEMEKEKDYIMVIWWIFTHISMDFVISIFGVEERLPANWGSTTLSANIYKTARRNIGLLPIIWREGFAPMHL